MGPGVTAIVGKPELGAPNHDYDVLLVQRLLAKAAKIVNDPKLDPKEQTGKIPKPSARSATVQAIEAFQTYFKAPTGLVYPGGRTMCRLLNVAHGNPNIDGGYYFPFPTQPAQHYATGMRRFGADRSGGARAHAGCDFYFAMGTEIYAMADGLVIEGPSPFYAQTFALTIEHGHILVRYGEIQANAFVQANQRVAGGQKIARVGHLVGINVPSDMLHLEMYSTTVRSPLTVNAQNSKRRADGVPFLRRSDLMDPTAILGQARLPRAYAHQPTKRDWVSY